MLRELKHSFFAPLMRFRCADQGVLIMRSLALLCGLLICAICTAQLVPTQGQQVRNDKTTKTEKPQLGSEKSPFFVLWSAIIHAADTSVCGTCKRAPTLA
jgi:hypothetical protein